MLPSYAFYLPVAIVYWAGVIKACPPPFHLQGWEDFYHKPPEEAFLKTPELIERFGYPVETHEVTTCDGYMLTLFRIPFSPKNSKVTTNVDKEPVLVQHGLVSSSDDWFTLGPKSSLPLILADLGFDVWLGNARGNEYSQKHVSDHSNNSKYWNFSYHEMGIYDIPAVFDMILAKTGKEKLSYIGHSMGTTMFFIAMDRHPELQDKVRKMVALSPAAYLSHVKTPMGILSLIPSATYAALNDLLNGGQIFFHGFNKWLNSVGPMLCSGNIPACLCQDVMFFMVGYDYSQYTYRTSSIVAGHTPNDGSGKSLVHYLQWVRSDEFQEYDYELLGNLGIYGTALPPKYSLAVNHVDTLVMYAPNDWLIQPEDALKAIKELGNARALEVNDTNFSHLDFMYATDVKELVYDHCVDFLLA